MKTTGIFYAVATGDCPQELPRIGPVRSSQLCGHRHQTTESARKCERKKGPWHACHDVVLVMHGEIHGMLSRQNGCRF